MAITVQDTYLTDYAQGFPGMLANGETQNRISRTIEDAAGIAFGKAAFRGAGDHGVTATPAANKFMGVTIADIGVVPGLTGTPDVFPQYATASLLKTGVILITVGAAVAQGDQAYVTSAGAFTNVATSNTSIPARFDTTAASGGIARLRVFEQ
ncbi:hypothetical protein [Novosphingobium sp. ZW T3_23]|uniref:structural cement protein Gp24 n=1 Tax=Novosphingobium sp. ZW T3_23 TaxID=3378084 RepID=UPI003854DF38